MRTLTWWLAGLCSAGLYSTIAFAAGSGEDKQVSLTIYNRDLALVEHLRPTAFTAGRQRIEFAGVSAQILPQTVSFAASNLELLEQNFDYDLLTPAKLMEKAVGGQVRVVRTNPATGAESSENAEVLSTAGGTVLRIGNRIEVLRDDGLPARVILDKVPENLRARPTLSVLVNAAQPAQQDVRLTYLTRGLSWAADYVAVFDETRGSLSLQGWITLSNKSGTSFANARTYPRGRSANQRLGTGLVWQAHEAEGTVHPGHRKHRSFEAQRLLPLSDPAAPRRSRTIKPSRSASWNPAT